MSKISNLVGTGVGVGVAVGVVVGVLLGEGVPVGLGVFEGNGNGFIEGKANMAEAGEVMVNPKTKTKKNARNLFIISRQD